VTFQRRERGALVIQLILNGFIAWNSLEPKRSSFFEESSQNVETSFSLKKSSSFSNMASWNVCSKAVISINTWNKIKNTF